MLDHKLLHSVCETICVLSVKKSFTTDVHLLHVHLQVGQVEAAFEVLTVITNSRRYRTVWQSTHEKVMESYVTLAVTLRKR